MIFLVFLIIVLQAIMLVIAYMTYDLIWTFIYAPEKIWPELEEGEKPWH